MQEKAEGRFVTMCVSLSVSVSVCRLFVHLSTSVFHRSSIMFCML